MTQERVVVEVVVDEAVDGVVQTGIERSILTPMIPASSRA
jgi:hypothetical protein